MKRRFFRMLLAGLGIPGSANVPSASGAPASAPTPDLRPETGVRKFWVRAGNDQ